MQGVLTNCLALLNIVFGSVSTRDTPLDRKSACEAQSYRGSRLFSGWILAAIVENHSIDRNVTKSQRDVLISVVDD